MCLQAPTGVGEASDAEAAYARMEALSQAIKNELQNDLRIHDSAVLPQFVNLPQITAAEYCRVRQSTAASVALASCSDA